MALEATDEPGPARAKGRSESSIWKCMVSIEMTGEGCEIMTFCLLVNDKNRTNN